MEKISERLLSYGIIGLIFSVIYSVWWQTNAPYCCVNQCGQTVDAMTCLPGLLCYAIIILSVMAIASGVYIEFR